VGLEVLREAGWSSSSARTARKAFELRVRATCSEPQYQRWSWAIDSGGELKLGFDQRLRRLPPRTLS